MKIHIFLIAFNFIQLCVSIQTNLSINKDQTDPITLLRNKRQIPDYTRWRSNIVTTQEFIVKVDDEGYNPTTDAPIAGVSIRQAPNLREKIIIGGVRVPQGDTELEIETPIEYTRFVAPTTTKSMDVGDVVYPPVKIHRGGPQYATMKYLNREGGRPDSALATRSPAPARQYVPITPVGFYPRSTETPLTPSPVPSKTDPHLNTRTHPAIEHTKSNFEFSELQPVGYGKDLEEFFATFEVDDPTRSNPSSFITTLRSWTEEDQGTKKTTISDLDAYHMFFNEEDNEIDENKKDGVSKLDNDDKYNQTDQDDYSRRSLTETITDAPIKEPTTCVTTPGENVTVENILRQPRTCSLLNNRLLSFDSPRTLPEIHQQLKKWDFRSPIAKMVDITANNLTTMDNPIYMMIVDDPSSGQAISAKDIVMIVAGIQGRDHHAVMSAMYVLYQLIEQTETHTDLLTKYRFWIIPVFNPDGFDYSSTFQQRREWKKNLHQSWDVCNGHISCKDCATLGLRCAPQPCYGVNLDRNFEYQWIPAEELRAEHPCGDLYAGDRQLSEPETKALTSYLHDRGSSVRMFIAFKEGDLLGVMYPHSHTRKKRAFDEDYRLRASRAATAASSIMGRPYVAGQTSEFLPLYAGGIEDWVDGHLGIDNTYTIMMYRPTDAGNSRLMTEHVVHEAYAALDTLLLETSSTIQAHRLKARRSGATMTSPTYFLVLTTIIPIINS